MASERGSALFWWVIILLVLFLVAGSLAYVEYSDAEDAKATIGRLRDELRQKDESFTNKNLELLNLSNVVGWQPGENQPTQPGLVTEKMDKVRARFTTVGQSDRSLESVIAKMEAAYEAKVREAEEQTRALKDSRSAEEQARAAHQDQMRTLNERVGALENEKREVETRLDSTKRSLDEEVDRLRNQVSSLQGQMKDASEVARREKNELVNQVLGLQANLRQTSEKIKGIKQKDVPDARVIGVSDPLGLAYLDVGRRHGLKTGTVFEIYQRGKGGEKLPKGRVQVRSATADSCTAGILETVDRYNPIVSGDLAQNLLFDRDKAPVFVILGNLPGRYSLQEAKRILENMGARVDTQVSVDTDFLVLGRKEAEDALAFEERDEYRKAQLYNVQIIGFDELRSYLEP